MNNIQCGGFIYFYYSSPRRFTDDKLMTLKWIDFFNLDVLITTYIAHTVKAYPSV